MKFDLLYELQMPKPHDERSEWRCYHEALEQIELADRLGYDTVWEVEHHFLTEFAHSSAPEVFLAAVSQRTKNIRIGHGVTLLPHKFNHPIRVAERVAALDIVSNGRVEFGTGRSSQFEQAGFEIDTDRVARHVAGVARDHPAHVDGVALRVRRQVREHPAARHPAEAAAEAASAHLGGRDQPGDVGARRQERHRHPRAHHLRQREAADGARAGVPRGAPRREAGRQVRQRQGRRVHHRPRGRDARPRPSRTAAPTRPSITCCTPSASSAASPIRRARACSATTPSSRSRARPTAISSRRSTRSSRRCRRASARSRSSTPRTW